MDSNESRNWFFDTIAFVKTPQVLVRLVSVVFSVIVFGCIADGVDSGDPETNYCAYNKENEVCNFGVAVGVIAFSVAITFLVVDGIYQDQGGAFRRISTIADLCVSALCTVLWFVAFCYLADRWRASGPLDHFPQKVQNNARAAIAFCFFSIVTWASSSVLAVVRLRRINAYYGLGHAPDQSSGYHQSGSPAQADSSEPYQRPALV
eukprot:m.44203 g.44203  ORF g.44203 m.44203 type:complete len:206 (+) comp33505_c0_seq1:24-641(+)